jgi:putative transposase
VKLVSEVLGYSRQNYYKQSRQRDESWLQQEKIKQMVLEERKLLPRLGTRKLYKLIKTDLETRGLKCGRDKLFDIIRQNGLLIKPRRQYVKTTNSRHWMKKYPNRIRDIEIERPDEVWVSDITYIKTDEGYSYLTMITDAYSRKIMGFNVSGNMSALETVKALEMALKNRRYKLMPLIHHSDRGLQYCSQEYVRLAQKNHITISMTENSDPYENALAERMNRTIKEEFCMNQNLKSINQVCEAVSEAVWLYNTYRPHLALNYDTPDNVYQKTPALGEAGAIS